MTSEIILLGQLECPLKSFSIIGDVGLQYHMAHHDWKLLKGASGLPSQLFSQPWKNARKSRPGYARARVHTQLRNSRTKGNKAKAQNGRGEKAPKHSDTEKLPTLLDS